MKNTRTVARRIAAGHLLAATVFAGALIAGGAGVAASQPGDTAQCSAMAMPGTIAAPAPSRMTRAGQIAASRSSVVAESMPAQCSANGR